MSRKTISKMNRQKVYEMYNGHCAYCGGAIAYKDMQVDHLIPVGGYKEQGTNDMENLVTGVRHAESAKRTQRGGLEVAAKGRKRLRVDPDNPDNEEMVRVCPTWGKHILNPIIDWEDEDVWEFIKTYNIPYCSLYDQGYKRLGCIGCPMASNRQEELEKYPKYKQAYVRAFDRMLKNMDKATTWQTGEDVYEFWVSK